VRTLRHIIVARVLIIHGATRTSPSRSARQHATNGCTRIGDGLTCFIAVPKSRFVNLVEPDRQVLVGVTSGLFIELKREGTRIKKKDGSWANEHVAEQSAVLEKLRAAGYAAEFAVGLNDALKKIDDYLGGTGSQGF